MNHPSPINEMSHDEIRDWLKRALQGQEQLPRLAPDESSFVAILRLEKTLKAAARDSLREGCHQLVREFCADGHGEGPYLEELLSLASAFKNPETVQMLAQLALELPRLPRLSLDIRLAVLAALVDTPPPQQPAFWEDILKQDPEKYSGLALSGLLATDRAKAIRMLPEMPNSDRAGQAAALKLDLTWDDLTPKQRSHFVQDVEAILPLCPPRFAGPVKAWADSKETAPTSGANPSLRFGIASILDGDASPQVWSSRLCDHCAV